MWKSWCARGWRVGAVVGAVLWLGGCKEPLPALPPTPGRPVWSDKNPKLGNDNRPRLSGTARDATAVQVFLTPDCTGEAVQTVPTSGTDFSVTVEVPEDRATQVSALALNEDTGQASSCSEPYTYTEDSTGPEAPVLTGSTPTSPGNSMTPKLVGLTEPRARVTVYPDPACAGTGTPEVTANASGQFEVAVPAGWVQNGTTSFYAAAVDVSGNRSACSGALAYVLDRIPPTRPQILGLNPRSPSNDNTPQIHGTAEPGSRVTVREAYASNCFGNALAEVTAAADGTFEATLRVSDNTILRFSVTSTDLAGNVSECNYSDKYEEDSIPPAMPRLAANSPRSPGSSRTPLFEGTMEWDSTVLLYASADCTGAPVASHYSVYTELSLTAPPVPENTVSVFSLAARDDAGNASPCTGPVTYLHDDVAPEAVAASVVDGPNEDLSFQPEAILEAHWSGFAPASDIVDYQYAVSRVPGCGQELVVTWTPVSGTRTRTPSALPDGQYYQCVRARDAAGNVSAIASSNGVRVDTQAPQVVSHTPAAGAWGVDVRAPVTVVFSEAVDPATVPERFTLVANGSAVAGTVACVAERCTFTPDAPLPYLETLTATVAAGVLDSIGRPLASASSFSFSTRGRRWSPGPTALHGVRPGNSPEIALDGQGHALAVWAQGGTDNTWRLYASRAPASGPWGPAQVLDAGATGNVARPALAVNAAGRGMAAWELQEGAQADLYAAEYLPGTGWSAPQLVEARPERVSAPRVAVDGQGRTLAVWRQSDGVEESLWAAHHVPGQGWSPPVLLETESGAVSAHALAAEAGGNALVAWLQPGTSGTRVLASRYRPGSGWTSPELLSESAAGPTVAVGLGGDGSALVLFRRLESTVYRLYAARKEGGLSWAEPVLVPTAAASVESDFALAVDFQGVALAAVSQINGTSSLSTCRFTPDLGWGTCQQAGTSFSQPSLGVDAGGNFHLVWVYNYQGTDYVLAARYPEGSSALGPPVLLDGLAGGTSKRPRVAANAAGGAVAVWARDNGTGSSGNLIYASTFD